MLTVHHLENSQSIRILWLLEELGLDYHLQKYARVGPNTLAPLEYKALHPIGKAPTISDGQNRLAETNAIVDYLLDQQPNSPLRPTPGSPSREAYLYWFHATQGSLMPLLLQRLIFSRLISRSPRLIRPLIKLVINRAVSAYLQPNLSKMLGHIDNTLSNSMWIAGNQLTAADIVIGYCLEVAQVRVDFGDDYPHIERYLLQMRKRPAYQRALQKSGGFSPLAA
ncbi:glutathione S-transferase family protein [Ferrimonas aestuarii]|uniref:Glutathione S-transferase n=1 Tax=Ferrimonas aestuarii TaxID=2569539 RepID=A0A4U1BT06_9GAMM|nr:glutathione S-transferase [Ferrimonas aestuarii]TKB58302.1 glutathione S-transferase [Ferrimonas aestuarii]